MTFAIPCARRARCVSRRARSGFPIASRRSAPAPSMPRRTASTARSRSLAASRAGRACRVDAQGPATVDGPKGLRVTATGELAKLGPLIGQSSASGHAVLVADVTGRWRDPVVTGKLELRSPSGRRSARGRDRAALRAHPALPEARGRQRAARACAGRRIGQSRVASDARLPRFRPRKRFASICRRRRKTRAWRMRGRGFRRRAAAAGRCARASSVKGTLAAWHATGQVESSSLTWPAIPAARDLSATFEATPDRIEVSAFKAVVLDAPLTARGRWRWAGGGEVEASTGLVDLARLPGVPARLRVEGRARANVTASVRDGRVNGSGKLVGERLAVAGWALGPAHRGRLAGRQRAQRRRRPARGADHRDARRADWTV